MMAAARAICPHGGEFGEDPTLLTADPAQQQHGHREDHQKLGKGQAALTGGAGTKNRHCAHEALPAVRRPRDTRSHSRRAGRMFHKPLPIQFVSDRRRDGRAYSLSSDCRSCR